MTARVIIVDDDEYLRDVYREVLESEGYQVDTAIDGEDGLNKLQSSKYDIVLLDIMMPKLDGIGVLKKLKEKAQSSLPIVIFLTNLANDPSIEQFMSTESSVKSYLVKANITPDKVVEEVKKYLGITFSEHQLDR